MDDKETKTWPFLTLPPTFGKYPSLSPWSFQRPYQASTSGLLFPTTYPSVNRPLYQWEIDMNADNWTVSFQPVLQATTSTSMISTSFIYPDDSMDVKPPLNLPRAKRQAPVVGYRAWRVNYIKHLGRDPDVVLRSTGTQYQWLPGINEANCMGGDYPGIHTVPLAECTCGFWVMSDLDILEQHIQHMHFQLVGAVMGWGTVIQHGNTGWRAQYAKPIALLDLKEGGKNRKLQKQIAKVYGIPIFNRQALEMVVQEHDGTLPLELP